MEEGYFLRVCNLGYNYIKVCTFFHTFFLYDADPCLGCLLIRKATIYQNRKILITESYGIGFAVLAIRICI